MRFKIIMGIAQGVAYLHQCSGLGVIHRDLKPGHILLDVLMNPKISGFGFARTLVAHQSELVTDQVVGSFGYLDPEYVSEMKYSVKSDVYSFGVIVLQIVSGRGWYEQRLPLLDHLLTVQARKLWSEGKALELVDNTLGGAFSVEEALRCIQLGLL